MTQIYAAVFSPNSKLLATASRDKTIRVYNVESGSTMHKLTGHNDHIRGLCFTPKGELVSASLDETALVFGQPPARPLLAALLCFDCLGHGWLTRP